MISEVFKHFVLLLLSQFKVVIHDVYFVKKVVLN